jgi:hypothetical protein
MSSSASSSSSFNLRPETLKDIESIDADKHGFNREEVCSIPSDLPTSYKPTNVHIFLSSALKATEWDSKLGNVSSCGDVEKFFKSLKESKSEFVYPKNGGPEPFRVTVFNTPEFNGINDQVLIATANNHSTEGSAASSSSLSSDQQQPAVEAKLVSLPVSALLSSSSSSGLAPWNDPAVITKDYSNDRFVMICSHVKRDPRCGFCGAILADLLQQELEKQLSEMKKAASEAAVASSEDASKVAVVKTVGAFTGKIHVARVSHVGGHSYAGNLGIVSRDGGVMFGCVNPSDVPLIAKGLLSSQPISQSLLSIESLKVKVRGALLAGVRSAKF